MNLRDEGRLRVLQALYDSAGTSRPELVRRTGLSRATVSSLVADLITAGIVQEDPGPTDLKTRPTGRPAQQLSLNPGAGYALGADIGHAHVRVVLCDLTGKPVWNHAQATEADRSPHETLDLAAELIRRAMAEREIPRARVLGLGAGIASPVTADGTLGAEGIMPGWTGLRPAEELHHRTGIPTQLINDANAGALAEHLYGAARTRDDLIYIRLSAGIGAGIITGDRLLTGSAGLAGEIGHLPAVAGGRICRCGNRGCLETIASPPAIARQLADGWDQPVTPDELPALLAAGDTATRRVVTDAGHAVGHALAYLVTLINPRLIVVGGDLAALGQPLLDAIRYTITDQALPSAASHVTVVPGELGPSAEVRGAAAWVLAHAPLTLAALTAIDPHQPPS